MREHDLELIPEPPRTETGWEIHPDSLRDLLVEIHRRHRFGRYLITENGAAMPDLERVEGRIADHDRIDYLRRHPTAVGAAIEAGVPVAGHFAWSAFDNFEWALGYEKRFGLIEVDYESMARIPKLSADGYADVARTGVVRAD